MSLNWLLPSRDFSLRFHLISLVTAFFFALVSVTWAQSDLSSPIAAEIRSEATLPNNSELGHPLPLAGHWNRGTLPGGFSPEYQLQMIEKGHHCLMWFQMPYGTEPGEKYYEYGLKKAAALGLPISFVGTQWEHRLSESLPYRELPPEENPNVVDSDGKILPKVSPFGPIEPWREVGKSWTDTALMKKIQEWYPDPPLILFVSNNEQPKLQWSQAEEDRRYVAQYGKGRSDEFKRNVVGNGWIERYRALQAGMQDGLMKAGWKEKAVFVGFNAFGPREFARFAAWIDQSLYRMGRIAPWPLAWDGASPPFYTDNGNDITDFRVWSPQIQAMNWVFMNEEAQRLNPNFWFEFSTWDGHLPTADNDKHKYYARLGQVFTPSRYGGMIRYGMWLTRPRLVREYRAWNDILAEYEPYFLAILSAVDEVYENPILKKFWRQGSLVVNWNSSHPYQNAVPSEYVNADRWFLLDTNLNPPRPWTSLTEIPVFCLALVLGNMPQREWLVYAHSPLQSRRGVRINIPEYNHITVDASQAGTFFYVKEINKEIMKIECVNVVSGLRLGTDQ